MRFSGLIGVADMRCLQVNGQNSNATVAEWATGLQIPYLDPFWGGGELLYAQAVAVLEAWSLCYYLTSNESFVDPESGSTRWRFVVKAGTIDTAINGNGVPVCLPIQNMAVGNFGWFLTSAIQAPARSTALHTGGANVYSDSVTAGRLTTTFQALRHIISARNVSDGSLSTQTQILDSLPGQNVLRVKNRYRTFLGAFASGTGIPGGATVTGFGEDGLSVHLSANLTANGAGSLATFTQNNGTIFYPQVAFIRPCLRGPAT